MAAGICDGIYGKTKPGLYHNLVAFLFTQASLEMEKICKLYKNFMEINVKAVTLGFDTVKEKYPNIKIVDIQYGGGDHLKSADLAKAIIQAHPNLKGFFGANEGSAIGILLAVKELKKEGQIVIIGYDSGKHQINAIREGIMAGAITQNPVGMGYMAVEAAVKAIKGEELPKQIDSGFYWYDKTNIDDPKIQAVLYE